MACSCGKKSSVEYEVTFNNGTPVQRYASVGEAQAALQSAGRPAGSAVRPVAKAVR